MNKLNARLAALLLGGVLQLLLSACQTAPTRTDGAPTPAAGASAAQSAANPPPAAVVAPTPAPPPEPVVVEPSPSERQLAAGQAAFDRGEYAAAIRLLQPLSKESTLDTAAQLHALKTLAFAQCLTNATKNCRDSFVQAFRLDAEFELAPAERGHPVWGPQFDRARRIVQAEQRKAKKP